MAGFVEPTNFVRPGPSKDYLHTPYINTPMNVTASISQFVKTRASHDRTKLHYNWSIEFFNGTEYVAAWIYSSEEDRDSDYEMLTDLNFF